VRADLSGYGVADGRADARADTEPDGVGLAWALGVTDGVGLGTGGGE
jgi:hypothetical protein